MADISFSEETDLAGQPGRGAKRGAAADEASSAEQDSEAGTADGAGYEVGADPGGSAAFGRQGGRTASAAGIWVGISAVVLAAGLLIAGKKRY